MSSEEIRPTERKGGDAPGDSEIEEKGPWAEHGSRGRGARFGRRAPEAPEDPELGSDVTGRTAASDEPATSTGVDPEGGAQADAVTDGGQNAPEDAEPDLRDAPSEAGP